MSSSSFQVPRHGFTLLELLMVISIISLLAVIMFDYLGASRDKGTDGATTQNIVNARSQAEVYFANYQTYEGMCNDGELGIFLQLQAAADAQNLTPQTAYADNVAGTAVREACHDDVTAYAAWVPLKQGGGICIDSKNTTRISTTPLPAMPVGSRFACPL